MKQKIELENKYILITGGAGFIGSNLIINLLRRFSNIHIISIDSMATNNPIQLKEWRLKCIEDEVKNHPESTYTFIKGNIADVETVQNLFNKYNFSIVVNLAAQAGVRYSINHPDTCMASNIIGFYNIIEACRKSGNTKHLVYASSSSVYGGSTKVPFSVDDNVDTPVSLYAATKKSNELIAHSYSKLYNIPCTGLRFFTVYGPGGRTDMAYYSFTEKLVRGDKIDVFNYGDCQRDFTYIDDIVEGIIRVMGSAPEKKTGEDGLPIPPYALYNIGGGNPENLMDFVHILADELIRAKVLDNDFDIDKHVNLLPMQAGDVPVTYADASGLERDFGFKPTIDLRTGLRKFAEWYSDYNRK